MSIFNSPKVIKIFSTEKHLRWLLIILLIIMRCLPKVGIFKVSSCIQSTGLVQRVYQLQGSCRYAWYQAVLCLRRGPYMGLEANGKRKKMHLEKIKCHHMCRLPSWYFSLCRNCLLEGCKKSWKKPGTLDWDRFRFCDFVSTLRTPFFFFFLKTVIVLSFGIFIILWLLFCSIFIYWFIIFFSYENITSEDKWLVGLYACV